MTPQLDDSKNSIAATVSYAVVGIVVIAFLIWSVPKLWGWHVRNWQAFDASMSGDGKYYCQSLKKIVQADPIFEDNGKYEGESYRVTYEDGSVGLIDQATMQSGYYCVSGTWVQSNKTPPEGWVLRP